MGEWYYLRVRGFASALKILIIRGVTDKGNPRIFLGNICFKNKKYKKGDVCFDLSLGLLNEEQKNKKMKTKVGKILLLLLIVAIMALMLTACLGGVDDEGFCTVVLANGQDVQEYSVDLSSVTGDDGLLSVLQAMNRDGMPLTVSSDGMLMTVGSLTPDSAAREYIRIYTSVESDFDTSAWFAETEYNGIRFGTAGVGASDLSVVDGAVFYLAIETW